MISRPRFASAVLAAGVCLLWFSGCEKQGRSQQQNDFAPGAFPPTVSDTDYHRNSWVRADCLSCHETGIQEAPEMRHVSVPDLAKDAKCRTCHLFIPGSVPGPQ